MIINNRQSHGVEAATNSLLSMMMKKSLAMKLLVVLLAAFYVTRAHGRESKPRSVFLHSRAGNPGFLGF